MRRVRVLIGVALALGGLSAGSPAAAAFPSPPEIVVNEIRAVDVSGRYIVVNDEARDDVRIDRLTGTVQPLDRVLTVSADAGWAVTVAGTPGEVGTVRWVNLATGSEAPIPFAPPSGTFVYPLRLSGDGQTLIAGLSTDATRVVGDVTPDVPGTYAIRRDGSVRVSPIVGAVPSSVSANGRWVLLYRDLGPTMAGPDEYYRWDTVTGGVSFIVRTMNSTRVPMNIGDDGRFLEREFVTGDGVAGGDSQWLVRHPDGSTVMIEGPGGEGGWVMSADGSIATSARLNRTIVVADTRTGARSTLDARQVGVFNVPSWNGGVVVTIPLSALSFPLASDLLVLAVPGRGAAPKVRANERVVVQVAGEGGVPDDAKAVVLNVTVTNPAGPGFATVWPCGSKPNASNVNFTAAGTTVANAVVAKLSSSGAVCIAPSTAAELIVDVQGYFAGDGYVGTVPDRVADSRDGETDVVPNLARGARFVVPVAGVGAVPDDASAVVVNVTATNTAGPGYLTVWPCDESRPDASNVNVTSAGATVANAVVAKVADSGANDGSICVYTSAAADVIVDVQGYFLSDAYVGVVPDRVADSRDGQTDAVPNLATGARFVVPVAGVGSVPDDAPAVVVNVTATNTAGPGYLTVWPCDESRPDASNVNFASAGATVANAVVAKVADSGADDGSICVYARTAADVIVDVQGYFTGTEYSGVSPSRIYDTRG